MMVLTLIALILFTRDRIPLELSSLGLIAVLATMFGPRVIPGGIPWILGALAVGAAIDVNVGGSLVLSTSSTNVCEPIAFSRSIA